MLFNFKYTNSTCDHKVVVAETFTFSSGINDTQCIRSPLIYKFFSIEGYKQMGDGVILKHPDLKED